MRLTIKISFILLVVACACNNLSKLPLPVIDFSQSKMIDFDLESHQYLSSHKANILSDCAWLPDGYMAWFDLSGYNNSKRKNFYVSITDQKLKQIKYGFEANFTTGYLLSLGKRFFEYEHHCYIVAPFISTVYEASTDTIKPAYNVSFGNYAFPTSDWLSNHLNNDDNYLPELFKSPYVCAFNLNETSDYLLATFLIHGNQDYYAIYNKNDKHSRIYINTIIGTHNDYFVCSLSTALLKRTHNIEQADLRNIVNNLSEEDNPIICMFKFK
ncbi:MAG: 6-bladed beta-propeller [Parabacteroides sp.]